MSAARRSTETWRHPGVFPGIQDMRGCQQRDDGRRCRDYRRLARQQGASMVVALIVAGVLSATSLASTESFLLAIRASEQRLASVWRFHAAETALIACERRLIRERERMPLADIAADPHPDGDVVLVAASERFGELVAEMGRRPEPYRWRRSDAFVGLSAENALSQGTLTHWRLVHGQQSVDVPCLQETWIDRPGVGQVHLMTVRVGPQEDVGAYLASASADDRRGGSLRRRAPQEAGVWLQSITVSVDTQHRHFWRPIAEPPS